MGQTVTIKPMTPIKPVPIRSVTNEIAVPIAAQYQAEIGLPIVQSTIKSPVPVKDLPEVREQSRVILEQEWNLVQDLCWTLWRKLNKLRPEFRKRETAPPPPPPQPLEKSSVEETVPPPPQPPQKTAPLLPQPPKESSVEKTEPPPPPPSREKSVEQQAPPPPPQSKRSVEEEVTEPPLAKKICHGKMKEDDVDVCIISSDSERGEKEKEKSGEGEEESSCGSGILCVDECVSEEEWEEDNVVGADDKEEEEEEKYGRNVLVRSALDNRPIIKTCPPTSSTVNGQVFVSGKEKLLTLDDKLDLIKMGFCMFCGKKPPGNHYDMIIHYLFEHGNELPFANFPRQITKALNREIICGVEGCTDACNTLILWASHVAHFHEAYFASFFIKEMTSEPVAFAHIKLSCVTCNNKATSILISQLRIVQERYVMCQNCIYYIRRDACADRHNRRDQSKLSRMLLAGMDMKEFVFEQYSDWDAERREHAQKKIENTVSRCVDTLVIRLRESGKLSLQETSAFLTRSGNERGE